eukprot:791919-Pelagomonas_calceolata.AAC.2
MAGDLSRPQDFDHDQKDALCKMLEAGNCRASTHWPDCCPEWSVELTTSILPMQVRFVIQTAFQPKLSVISGTLARAAPQIAYYLVQLLTSGTMLSCMLAIIFGGGSYTGVSSVTEGMLVVFQSIISGTVLSGKAAKKLSNNLHATSLDRIGMGMKFLDPTSRPRAIRGAVLVKLSAGNGGVTDTELGLCPNKQPAVPHDLICPARCNERQSFEMFLRCRTSKTRNAIALNH